MPKALVTGGAGFIGSALCLHLICRNWSVTTFDALTYAAAPGTVATLKAAGARVIEGDVCDRRAVRQAIQGVAPDVVFHLAAETHVDRSIDAAADFITTNIHGTFEVLEAVRARRDSGEAAPVLVHVSTDEVFGTLELGDLPFREVSRYDPNSPYAASKAGADHLARAWARTYGLDIRISNCSNNYGPRQFPEKLIPLMILAAIHGQPMPVYGDGAHRRDWLHVDDHVAALLRIAERGAPGETYCIGGGAERSNLKVVEAICDHLDARHPEAHPYRELITFVDDRPGHDLRYAIAADKAGEALDWRPRHDFETGLAATIDWYLDHESWWSPLKHRYAGQRLGAG